MRVFNESGLGARHIILIRFCWYELVLWPQIEYWEIEFVDGQVFASDDSTLWKWEQEHGQISKHVRTIFLDWLCYLSYFPFHIHYPPLGSSLVPHDSSPEILHSPHMNEERLMPVGWFQTCGLHVYFLYDISHNISYKVSSFHSQLSPQYCPIEC